MIIYALVDAAFNFCFHVYQWWKRDRPIDYMSYEWRSKLL